MLTELSAKYWLYSQYGKYTGIPTMLSHRGLYGLKASLYGLALGWITLT